MDFKTFEGKKVYVKLLTYNQKTGFRVYTGTILEVTFMGQDAHGFDYWMFVLKDKFNQQVCFSSKEIKFIETQRC